MKEKILSVLKRIIYFVATWGKPIIRSKIEKELMPAINYQIKVELTQKVIASMVAKVPRELIFAGRSMQDVVAEELNKELQSGLDRLNAEVKAFCDKRL